MNDLVGDAGERTALEFVRLRMSPRMEWLFNGELEEILCLWVRGFEYVKRREARKPTDQLNHRILNVPKEPYFLHLF
jgi:hypothetical protein